MGKASRDKGKRGELEFSHLCIKEGYNTHRSAQHCGKTGEAPDVVGLPNIHAEVKRVETLSLYTAMEQAKRDSESTGKMPIVAHRRNNHEWLIIMTAEDWFKLYRNSDFGGNYEKT